MIIAILESAVSLIGPIELKMKNEESKTLRANNFNYVS
jgi:hypothetical protein